MKYLYALVFPLLLLLCLNTAYAQNAPHTSSQKQPLTLHNSQTRDLNQKALEWHLQPEEYQRYEELMEGPLGIYSPGLDPLTALGISARSDEERHYYAERQVVAESLRVERELAYQRAYDEAFKRLYPGLLPVDFGALSPPKSPSTTPLGSIRLAVFVKENCPPCDLKVQQLQERAIGFDIYMVGSNHDDMVIRRWATQVGIDPKKVFSRTITLNHDAGLWQTIAIGGELPAVVKEVGGKWQRQ